MRRVVDGAAVIRRYHDEDIAFAPARSLAKSE
jgi:hypothetical protein